MNNVATNSGKEKSNIFEAILCSPGMNEKCKVNLVLSRQNIILLSRLIETGLLSNKNGFEDEIINVLSRESLEEMKAIHEEILKKGNLVEFYQKLKLI
jgi:hypothetical protein